MKLSSPTFVEYCGLSDAGVKQPLQPTEYVRSSSSDSSKSYTGKTRPRRDVVEIAALKTQVETLSQELAEVKAARRNNRMELTLDQSTWQVQAQTQSQLRSAAQQENERLRAQMQLQTRIAKQLAGMLKRNSTNQVMNMLHHFELEARERAELTQDNLDEELGLAYLQTDAVLFDAEMFSLPHVFYDAQMRRTDRPGGLVTEFRRRLRLPHGLDVSSDAYWYSSPRMARYHQFEFGHNLIYRSDSIAKSFLFHCKHRPSKIQFSGRCKIKRYTTHDRVVVVWKTVMQASAEDTAPQSQLRLYGQGWVEMKTVGVSPPCTSVQSFVRYYTDSQAEGVWTPAAQQNAELRVMIEFVTITMEKYDAIPKQIE